MPLTSSLHGTTILAVRHRGSTALAGDGQVTLGSTVVKHSARKIRRLHNGQVLAGFAGSTGDAITLFTRFEAKIDEYRGNLERAAVELSKDWRSDRMLRRLEAFLVVADRESIFLLSGAGEVIAPDDGLMAVGSGGPYALAAARALVRHADMEAKDVAQESLKIAASICIYTNEAIVVENL
ncbi:MAG TPA: ATP-dependent protease subunit HslV [Vicinamibacteria bacterium]|jgi:ATP-dependent HslUV protease subunit HslV|nr:ATP-dependent protease subunit HslV [Vicinamibacteria bacterium]